MDTRTRSKLTPLVGGITAAATAAGGMAAVAHVAPAGAADSSATSALGAASLQGAGVMESCSAYFGYGKEQGAAALVEFDVVDVSGDDDGTDHAVEVDTDVVLVLENESGELLECVPEQVTEAEWIDSHGDDDLSPPFPGPGHYAFPSLALEQGPEDFGPVTSVGFRVVGIPALHDLVDPLGVKELVDPFLPPFDVFLGDLIDQRVLDLLDTEVGPAAAAAFEEAIIDCNAEEPIDTTDPDLLAAARLLAERIGEDPDELTEVDCFAVGFLHVLTSLNRGIADSTSYVEVISLSAPVAPAPPATPPAPPAAAPVTAAPTFTG